MTRFRIDIRRKEGLADPEGATTKRALLDLGYDEVTAVSFGRVIHLEIEGDADDGLPNVEEMCERLLANPVIEDYTVEVDR